MQFRFLTVFIMIFSLVANSLPIDAAVPNRVVYQGRLRKAGVGVAGPHIFVARLLSKDGEPLWSSGSISVILPATGEFSLLLEPTGVDWLNDDPRLEITVDGEKLEPADSFSSNPYAFVAGQVVAGSIAMT